MFNVGGPEIVLVILVALVVLGPEQLPKAMRTFGNVMGEVRKLSSGFQNEVRDVMNAADLDGSGSTGGAKRSGSTGSASPAESSPADAVQEVVVRNDQPTPTADAAPESSAVSDTAEVAASDARESTVAGDDGGSGTETDRPSAADRAAG